MSLQITILISVFTVILGQIDCSTLKPPSEELNKLEEQRLKRETIFSTPIFYDPMPVQTTGQPQPITPALTQPLQQQSAAQQQQPALPIVGALISNVPGLNGISSTLTTLLPLGNLGGLANLGALGNLGGLGNLGTLGNLGGLGNLGNLGALGNLGGGLNNLLGGGVSTVTGTVGNLGGLLSGSGNNLQCPVTQTLRCRCENLLSLPLNQGARSKNALEILQQNMKINQNGDKEISARLSNGLLLYQHSGIEKLANNQNSQVVQGYYTLQVKDNKYLTIYYTINDLDYTVKADVTAEPPQNDLDASDTKIPMVDF